MIAEIALLQLTAHADHFRKGIRDLPDDVDGRQNEQYKGNQRNHDHTPVRRRRLCRIGSLRPTDFRVTGLLQIIQTVFQCVEFAYSLAGIKSAGRLMLPRDSQSNNLLRRTPIFVPCLFHRIDSGASIHLARQFLIAVPGSQKIRRILIFQVLLHLDAPIRLRRSNRLKHSRLNLAHVQLIIGQILLGRQIDAAQLVHGLFRRTQRTEPGERHRRQPDRRNKNQTQNLIGHPNVTQPIHGHHSSICLLPKQDRILFQQQQCYEIPCDHIRGTFSFPCRFYPIQKILQKKPKIL